MAAARARRWAVVTCVVLVAAVVAAGCFLATRHVRLSALAAVRSTVTVSASASSSPGPTPSAVASAGRVPTTAPATGSAPAARAAALTAVLAPALRAGALGPSVRALVADAATGSTLYGRDASGLSAPASTTKLTTAAAILAVRDPTDRITTTVVAGAVAGQVVLVGGGDPTLSAAPAGQPTLYRNAARMSDLAAQVRRVVPGAITSVLVDDSLFSGPLEAPGWEPEDVPSDYQSGVTPAMVDGGLPATGGTVRVARPDLEAGRALATLLGVPTASVSTGVAAAGARRLALVRSAPIVDLVEQMLKNSDNVIADLLSRQVAIEQRQPASFAGAVVAVRQVLARLGVRLPATLQDGSGLSQLDRLTPAVLVAVLRAVLTTPRLGPIVTAMPVSGWDGTLGAPRYHRLGSTAAAGDVRAKTGSLTGVVTLAGVLADASGRLIVFAFMTDQVPDGGIEDAEAALDVAATRLVTCACR